MGEIEPIKTRDKFPERFAPAIEKFRAKGLSFKEIAIELGEPIDKIQRIHYNYIKEKESELFSARIGKVVELDSIYPKLLTLTDEELELAKETGNKGVLAGWVKIRLETAREYREFLESIGYIHKGLTDDTLKHNNPVEDNTDPILELIKLNKMKLIEDMKKLKEGKPNEPNGTTPTPIQ
jgi:hypothetical protein